MAHSSTATKSAVKATRKASQVGQAPPAFRPVQLAKLVDAVPPGTNWLHEMEYNTPSHLPIGDAKELIKRAGSKVPASSGRADQELPDL